MHSIELLVLLLAAAAALRVVARAAGVPHPVLLVVGGLLLSLVPGLPRMTVDPDTLFLVFVPPLLYWAAITTSLRDFRRQFSAIARYGTLVVLLTMAAVAAVAHALTPELTWPAAFVLGAIVSPPDPVAAVAVLRPLGAPDTVVTLLEGEGLVNDATALVAYRMAVAAAVTGAFSPGEAVLRLLVTGAGGAAVGLAVGVAVAFVRRRMNEFPIVENTVSLLTPFLAYVPADALGLSGVLAVVAVGLYLGRQSPTIGAPATRVQAEGTWTLVQFLLESAVFIIVGLDLPYVRRALAGHAPRSLLAIGLAVTLTCIAVRVVYTALAAAVLRAARRRRGARAWPPWNAAAFVAWTGMRGGDSLVIALALPMTAARGAPFPARDLIVFVTFFVILATLVLQGLTVVPLLRRLGLREDESNDAEEAHARRVAAEAGLARLDEATRGDGGGGAAADDVRALRQRQASRVRRWAVRDRDGHATEPAAAPPDGDGPRLERVAERQRALRRAMVDAERAAVVRLRDEGTIGDDVMRRLQRELDLEAMLIESGEDDAPESPYEAE